MRVFAGTMVHWMMTIIRRGRDGKDYEYSLATLHASVNEEEPYIIRLMNDSDRAARYGVVLEASGHSFDPLVAYGSGNLTSTGRFSSIKIDGNLALNTGPTPGSAQLNVTIQPFMWLELRGQVTWATVNQNPHVQLVPEIAGEQSLEATRDPSGTATTKVS